MRKATTEGFQVPDGNEILKSDIPAVAELIARTARWVHPDKPGSYILGVECDGATYHSSKSARDRDRLRQDVLEGLHWRIYRIWSTDWYRDPEREFDRLIQQIERLRTPH
jgi:hypothetical protein